MRIYLDTMVWLYSLESSSPFHMQASLLLAVVVKNRHQIIASPLVLGEILVLPKRNADQFTEAKYKRLFQTSAIRMFSDISRIADPFATLRAADRISSADALHVAVASVAGVDIFVTEDRKLLRSSSPTALQILSINEALKQL